MPSVRIDRPARAPESIPQPADPPGELRWAHPTGPLINRRFGIELSSRSVALTRAVLFGMFAVLFVAGAAYVGLDDDWSNPEGTLGTMTVMLLFAAVSARMARNILRTTPIRR